MAWKEVLFPHSLGNLGDGDIVAVSDALSELRATLRDIEDQIRIHISADHHQLYLSQFHVLKKLFAPNKLNDNFKVQRPLVSESVLLSLGHCAKDLPEEGAIEESELELLFNATSELFAQVEKGDLAPGLKRWTLRLLDSILRAINFYRISGSRGLRDALAKVIGELLVDLEKHKQVDANSWLKAPFTKIVSRLSSLVDTAQRIKLGYEITSGGLILIAEHAQKLLS